MASNQPIIVKKIKKVAGGHHGGAWKVAYADFVTAMMAFFLLMWLINTTSPEQKRGIADYFAPAAISLSTSGSGGALGGTSLSSEGVRSSGSNAIDPTLSPYTPKSIASAQQSEKAGTSSPDVQYDDISEDALNKAMAIRERAEFEKAEESLRQAMQSMPDLAELSKHLIIDQTPEGLRIQIVDQDGRSMFAPGSSEPLPRTQRMLEAVAGIVSHFRTGLPFPDIPTTPRPEIPPIRTGNCQRTGPMPRGVSCNGPDLTLIVSRRFPARQALSRFILMIRTCLQTAGSA
jgi:chemotaxis protein MotB